MALPIEKKAVLKRICKNMGDCYDCLRLRLLSAVTIGKNTMLIYCMSGKIDEHNRCSAVLFLLLGAPTLQIT